MRVAERDSRQKKEGSRERVRRNAEERRVKKGREVDYIIIKKVASFDKRGSHLKRWFLLIKRKAFSSKYCVIFR